MLVFYLVLLSVSFLFYILYQGVFSFYLFAFMAVMPLILFIMTKIVSKKVSVTFAKAQESCIKGSRIPITLRCENNSRIPVPNLIIEVQYFNTIDKQTDKLKISTPLFPRDVQYLTLRLSSEHYGTVKIKLRRARVCDMFRLFKIKIKPRDKGLCTETAFTVIPGVIPLENPIANYNDMGLETDEFSKDHKGDDPSEIFDIHEYQEGDKINRIHWKLSAKQDTTMVKDYSLPQASSMILIIDMDIDRTQTGHMKLYDTAVETVSAVSLYLAENKMAHKLIWFDTIRNENMTVTIKDEDESRVALSMLLRSGLHGNDRPAINNYMNTVDRFKCGHLLYFSARYDEGLTSVMNDADLAFRYTYMLIDPEKVRKEIYDDFADVVDVVSGAAAESIKDICF